MCVCDGGEGVNKGIQVRKVENCQTKQHNTVTTYAPYFLD